MRHYEKITLFIIALAFFIVCFLFPIRENSSGTTLDTTEITKRVEFSFSLAFKEMKTYAKKRNRKLSDNTINILAKNIVFYSQVYSEVFGHKISPYIIACIIARESNFKNLDNSSKGYMAVNTGTFKKFCQLYGLYCPKKNIGQYMYNNPEQVLEIGIICYGFHLSKQRGCIREALSIYRYGETGRDDYSQSIETMYKKLTGREMPQIAETVICK